MIFVGKLKDALDIFEDWCGYGYGFGHGGSFGRDKHFLNPQNWKNAGGFLMEDE